MGQGQYSFADVQVAPPPPAAPTAKMGQFSMADVATPEPYKSGRDKSGSYTTPADAANEMADMLGESVKSIAKISSPHVVYEMIRQHFPQLGLKPVLGGMPTANETMATATGMMAGADEGTGAPEGAEAPKVEAAPSGAAKVRSVLEHPAVTPWIDRGLEAMKEELMSKIPSYPFFKTLAKSAKGLAEGSQPPAAPASAPPIPETNGIPWGSGGQGPLDLRGKMIPQEIQDLRQITRATVNKTVPPAGDTSPLNTLVHSLVDKHLTQGDVANAEDVLDTAAKTANPKYTPPDRPRIVPSVQNIRENIAQANAAEAQPSRLTADALDDHALSQEMNWDLERHGWAADSEARREFIARNSTGVTKAELTGAAEKPVRYTKTPGVPSPGTPATDDLTDLLQRSLDAAKKAKAQQP